MKIIADTTCPGCKKDHSVELDVDNLEVKQLELPVAKNVRVESQQQAIQVQQPIEKVKEITKIPSYIPKYKCKNCDSNHKNKDYTQRPKYKCENCGQFSPDGKSCMWCDGKEFEELDTEELSEMGIEEPEEHEHDHAD